MPPLRATRVWSYGCRCAAAGERAGGHHDRAFDPLGLASSFAPEGLDSRLAPQSAQPPRLEATAMDFATRMSRLGTETAFEVLARAQALERKGRDVVHL